MAALINQKPPLVSVIIPTFNRRDLLKEALNSVLSQTYKNIEIIVVNDAGADARDLISSRNQAGNIVYLEHDRNAGPSAARNSGIRAAKGDYIAYLDDDDVFYPEHVDCLVEALERRDCGVAYTDSYHARQWLLGGKYITFQREIVYSCDFDRDRLYVENYIPMINVMHTKELFEKAGPFDESLMVFEDWDLLARLSRYTDFLHIHRVTAEVRVRGDSSNTIAMRRSEFCRMIKVLHARYDKFVLNDEVKGRQKSAQRRLEGMLEERYVSSSVRQAEVLHRYAFARNLLGGKYVLDVKCGTGCGCSVLARNGSRVLGLESDAREAKDAACKFAGDKVSVVKGRLGELPIKPGQRFDAVLCLHGLELEIDYEETIRQMKEVMRNDGMLLVAVPKRDIVNRNSASDREILHSDKPVEAFRDLLKRNFENVVIYGQHTPCSSWIFPLESASSAPDTGGRVDTLMNWRGMSKAEEDATSVMAFASDAPLKSLKQGGDCLDFSAALREKTGLTLGNMEERMDSLLGDLIHLSSQMERDKRSAEAHVESLQNELRVIKMSKVWRLAEWYRWVVYRKMGLVKSKVRSKEESKEI
jgi:glycosyltransferase involved in cell wall biosynthesis